MRPAPEGVLTMRASTASPFLAHARQYTEAWRVTAKWPFRCTRMTASHSSSLVVKSMRSRTKPALFTSTSRRPKVSIAVCTSARAPSQSAMSSVFAIASPPSARISSTTCCAGPVLAPLPSPATRGSFTTAGAPSCAKPSACSRPMPRPAPVTMTMRPSQMPLTGSYPTGGQFAATMPQATSASGASGRRQNGEGRRRRGNRVGLYVGARPRTWPAEEEALREVAVEPLEASSLLLGLDSFGDHLELEPVTEVDDAADERFRFGTLAEAGDEAAIDLELMDRQHAEVGQARVAGSEIVERDPHADLVERGERGSDAFGIVDQEALGDLQGE